MILDNLNDNQKQAVINVDGPVIVFAGAGTGKTRTLTHRVAYMISEKEIEPQHILAITFTNKATNEMKERLVSLCGPDSLSITIKTFHSLCAQILRKEIIKLGYSRLFEIIDEEDQLRIIKTVLEQCNYDKTKITPRHIKNVINRCKCFNIKSEYDMENIIHQRYEDYMKENNMLDFEDLLIKVYELFANFPDVLQKYQEKFQYILVDEFQDTNSIQYEIVKMLAIKSRNLFVVGDDDQSIYGFRGTDYENIKKYGKDFPEAKKFILDQNYRSTNKIVQTSHNLIKNNLEREKKELFSEEEGTNDDVEVYQAINENEEAEYVVDNIANLRRKGTPTNEIAVLYRNTVLSRNIELSLIKQKIPYKIYGGISYMRRAEIKDVLAYLRLIIDTDNVYAFNRIVNMPSRSIGKVTIAKIVNYKKENKVSLFTAIEAVVANMKEKSKKESLNNFVTIITNLSELLKKNEGTLVQFYEQMLEQTKYLSIYEGDPEKEERLANINEFKSVLTKLDNSGEVIDNANKLIDAFDEAILSDEKVQTEKNTKDGIILSTIHSVKGLEVSYVFIIGLEEGIFPNVYRCESESELEEERRVAYVAITRARKKLLMTYTYSRMLYGKIEKRMMSRFIKEALNTPKKTTVKTEKPKINLYENKTDYIVSDKIVHDVYGEGIIIQIDGVYGVICFTQNGTIKKFLLSHPAIQKKND